MPADSKQFDFNRLPKEVLDKIFIELALIDYDGIDVLQKSIPSMRPACQYFKLNYLGPVKYSRPSKESIYYDGPMSEDW